MIQKKYLTELTEAICRLKTQKEVLRFLKWILTPHEFEQLPLRLQIVKMIKKEVPQRKIAKELGVGIATVTRGARELQKNSFIIGIDSK